MKATGHSTEKVIGGDAAHAHAHAADAHTAYLVYGSVGSPGKFGMPTDPWLAVVLAVVVALLIWLANSAPVYAHDSEVGQTTDQPMTFFPQTVIFVPQASYHANSPLQPVEHEKLPDEESPITTPEPTPDVTPEPTADVTPEPTPDVTPEPTLEATPEPTPEATPEPTPEATPEPTPEPVEPAKCELSIQEQAIAQLMLAHVDQTRVRLMCDPILAQVARARAADMAQRAYFSHVNPDGHGPNYLVRRAGYVLPEWYNPTPHANNIESIAAGYTTVVDAWSGWMSSNGHRRHLLASEDGAPLDFYKQQEAYGIGYWHSSDSPYRHYYVVLTAPIQPGD